MNRLNKISLWKRVTANIVAGTAQVLLCLGVGTLWALFALAVACAVVIVYEAAVAFESVFLIGSEKVLNLLRMLFKASYDWLSTWLFQYSWWNAHGVDITICILVVMILIILFYPSQWDDFDR